MQGKTWGGNIIVGAVGCWRQRKQTVDVGIEERSRVELGTSHFPTGQKRRPLQEPHSTSACFLDINTNRAPSFGGIRGAPYSLQLHSSPRHIRDLTGAGGLCFVGLTAQQAKLAFMHSQHSRYRNSHRGGRRQLVQSAQYPCHAY